MKLKEEIERVWHEILFWLKREMSLTLIFWLTVFMAAFIRWLYLK